MVDRYQAYFEYKDSGVEWLGDVPSHWLHASLKYACSRITDGSHFSPKSIDDGKSYVTVRNLESGKVNLLGAAKISLEDFEKLEKSGCRPAINDVLFSKDGTVGKVAIVEDDDFVALSSLAIISPKNEKLSAKFLFYFIQSLNGEKQIESLYAGAALRRITLDAIVGIWLPLPNLLEQKNIANFLDHETAKIDTLIEKQQQLIKLLKEKRQAVISHAVTKGLNPDVPMRDSGVEWLGEVPEHWELPKLVQRTMNIGDGLHSTPQYQDGTGYYFVNGNNLVNGKIVISPTAKEVPEEEYKKHYIHLDNSSVLLSINGTIGNIARFNGELVILGKSAAYINCANDLLPQYLMFYLQSSQLQRYYDLEVTGTTIFNLSLNSIRQMKVCVPPEHEQNEIEKYCVNQMKKYGVLIDKASSAIELIKERRTALISAAVTGKIDVRNFKQTGV